MTLQGSGLLMNATICTAAYSTPADHYYNIIALIGRRCGHICVGVALTNCAVCLTGVISYSDSHHATK